MKQFIFVLLFSFTAFNLLADDITIIELHEQKIDKGFLDLNNDQILLDELDDEESDNQVSTSNNENNSTEEDNISELSDEKNINDVDGLSDEIITLPDYWERSNKEELVFLFENLKPNNSKVLKKSLIESITLNSLPPKNFTEEEFNFIKISNLIKLQERQKAFDMIEKMSEIQSNSDFYDVFKLNYYFSTYNLDQACEYNDSIDIKETTINKNYLLKVDIFCSFIQDKVGEADFLNSLLLDTNDSDNYFQKIYINLKSQDKSMININSYNFDEITMPLYSAMIRVGDMPLNNKFLEYDSANLSLPIILSGASEISLRLKAAHQAYKKDMFKAESLSALYQTVDFSYEELNSSDNKFDQISEIAMAYFFQKANIQILPITRIQCLVEFWEFAAKNDLHLLAYDISRPLIDNLEPSLEISDYGLDIAKAHIYNKNFVLASKWISFASNYDSDDSNYNENMESVKILYKLKNSSDFSNFKNELIESKLLEEITNDDLKQDTLLTILSVIGDQKEQEFIGNNRLLDSRNMPSRYLLNKIRNSYELKDFGQLILSINISMNNKNWNDIHPEHLKIILLSLQDPFFEEKFRDLIIEILEENKII